MKKRSGEHERAIRDYRMSKDGLWVGEPLKKFRGILSGIPTVTEQ
jgi:circadian clock protein KaiC